MAVYMSVAREDYDKRQHPTGAKKKAACDDYFKDLTVLRLWFTEDAEELIYSMYGGGGKKGPPAVSVKVKNYFVELSPWRKHQANKFPVRPSIRGGLELVLTEVDFSCIFEWPEEELKLVRADLHNSVELHIDKHGGEQSELFVGDGCKEVVRIGRDLNRLIAQAARSGLMIVVTQDNGGGAPVRIEAGASLID